MAVAHHITKKTKEAGARLAQVTRALSAMSTRLNVICQAFIIFEKNVVQHPRGHLHHKVTL